MLQIWSAAKPSFMFFLNCKLNFKGPVHKQNNRLSCWDHSLVWWNYCITFTPLGVHYHLIISLRTLLITLFLPLFDIHWFITLICHILALHWLDVSIWFVLCCWLFVLNSLVFHGRDQCKSWDSETVRLGVWFFHGETPEFLSYVEHAVMTKSSICLCSF